MSFDHAVLGVECNIDLYIRKGLIHRMPPHFNLESMEAGSTEYYDGLWDYIWAPYVRDFELAIDRDDIDAADAILVKGRSTLSG